MPDGDGDSSQANLTITITDANVPHISEAVSAYVDDDGLTGGNPVSGPNGPASFSGDTGRRGWWRRRGYSRLQLLLIHGSLGTVGLETSAV